MFHVKPSKSTIQRITRVYLISIMFHVKPIIKIIFMTRPESTVSDYHVTDEYSDAVLYD